MKTYARVVDGRVVEVIEPVALDDGTEVPIAERFHPDVVAQLVECSADQQVDQPEAPTPAPARQVTMRQARLALRRAGLLSKVSEAIASLPSPQRDDAQIEWDYATTVDRDSAFLQSLAGALGLDDAALDALFEQGAAL